MYAFRSASTMAYLMTYSTWFRSQSTWTELLWDQILTKRMFWFWHFASSYCMKVHTLQIHVKHFSFIDKAFCLLFIWKYFIKQPLTFDMYFIKYWKISRICYVSFYIVWYKIYKIKQKFSKTWMFAVLNQKAVKFLISLQFITLCFFQLSVLKCAKPAQTFNRIMSAFHYAIFKLLSIFLVDTKAWTLVYPLYRFQPLKLTITKL